ncbi:hypothetical protein Barb7_02386 [Bacteroidales bacterium Barb7]|nr:hypothetical protein Barb7_02386 [Bacteroidales bacterium Barb7]
MVTVDNDVWAKAFSPIYSTPFPILTEVILSRLSKALASTLFILSGITILEKCTFIVVLYFDR